MCVLLGYGRYHTYLLAILLFSIHLGLPSMGSHRVGHDWSDSAAAAATHFFCDGHIQFPLKRLKCQMLFFPQALIVAKQGHVIQSCLMEWRIFFVRMFLLVLSCWNCIIAVKWMSFVAYTKPLSYTWVYDNEVTFGKPLRMGTGARGTNLD